VHPTFNSNANVNLDTLGFDATNLTILSINIRSLLKNGAELKIHLLRRRPDFLLVQESWLDESVPDYKFDDYYIIARTDRIADVRAGGVVTYARSTIKNAVVMLEN
jgi:exonuclease III